MDAEVARLQDEFAADVKPFRRWIIVERDLMFEVHEHNSTGVAPMSTYPTKELAAARLLQIMGIRDPINPQSWPEEVQIGYIETDEGK